MINNYQVKIKRIIKSIIRDFLYNQGFLLVKKDDGYYYNSAISLIFAKHKYFLKELNKIERLFLTFLVDNYPKGSSQRSQDLFALWVNSFVNIENNTKFCIEFGAADGDFISNTKYLSEFNYRSLLIEPSRKFYKKLLKNRPRDICLNYVVSSSDCNEDKVEFHDAGLYSSTRVDIYDVGFKSNFINSYRVKQKSFNSILSEYIPSVTNFSYVSIDVEGNELGILQTINFKKFTFNCLTIECPIYSKDREPIIDLLKKNNYKVLFDKDIGITGVDLWFIHNDIYKIINK